MAQHTSTISGLLEQLPFAEFVQTLANLGKTGKLTVSRFGENGFVLFSEGRIIGAASSSVRETLGSLLIGQRLITDGELTAALELQRVEGGTRHLGTILLDQGVLSRQDLGDVVRQQTQRVVGELMRWQRGYFEFEALEIASPEEFHAELVEVVIPEGVSAESVLLAGAATTDEDDPLAAEIEALGGEGYSRRIASLRDLLVEIRSPEFTGELATKVMEHAAQMAQRCVLFSVESGSFRGMGYYGEGGTEEVVRKVRDLRIPVGEPSILADVAARHEARKGPLSPDPCNLELLESLGGAIPEVSMAAPLVVEGRVTMIIYADSLPGNEPLGPLSALELLALQAGLAMEKRILQEGRSGVEPMAPPPAAELHPDDFRALLEEDPEPIVIVNPSGAVLYANQVFATGFVPSVDEPRGMSLDDMVHPDDVEDLRKVLLEVSCGGAPGGKTVRFLESDDTWRKCYLLPNAVGMRAGERCVMLRALTAGQVHSRYDPLTGLLDFEALVDRVGRSLERARLEDGSPFALLLVGVDRFTLINVRYGWALGNEALRMVADRLAVNLRPGDVVSRVGGDRFCAILDRLRDPADGALVAERVKEFLGRPFEVGPDEVSLSFSIGVVTSEEGYASAEDMIEDAKTAMLEAKPVVGTSVVARIRATPEVS